MKRYGTDLTAILLNPFKTKLFSPPNDVLPTNCCSLLPIAAGFWLRLISQNHTMFKYSSHVTSTHFRLTSLLQNDSQCQQRSWANICHIFHVITSSYTDSDTRQTHPITNHVPPLSSPLPPPPPTFPPPKQIPGGYGCVRHMSRRYCPLTSV